jgi:hypothetical protein
MPAEGRQSHRLRAWIAPALVLLAGCGGSTHYMGDPLQSKPQKEATSTSAAPAPSATPSGGEYRDAKAGQRADEWELRWQQIQGPSDNVLWSDHFHVCGLKYRYRNYDQLFHCLDLLDAKIAAGGSRVPKADVVRSGAPIMTGWLRASAYAELGEPEIALKWADAAWAALPENFRKADSSITKFSRMSQPAPPYYVAAALGSGGIGATPTDMEEGIFKEGRNNPAALDLRAPMVAMALCVQRALLNDRLGNTAKADTAIEDLERFEAVRLTGGMGLMPSKIKPFKGYAQLLSIGPSFERGDYRRVVLYYEVLARKVGQQRRHERTMNALAWALFLPYKLLESAIEVPVMAAVRPSDARLFALAVEDVSNALLYAESLARLGRTDDARAMLDTLLALPEIHAMGNLYWVTLYERGVIALKQGHGADGVRLLRDSVAAIESVRGTISFEAAKIGFAGDKQTVYAALIGALAAQGDWRGALIVAERAKARALVDLLAQRRDLAPPPSNDARVRELFAQAATVESAVGLAATDDTVRGIKLIADARDTLGTAAPEAASLVAVQNVDLDAIALRIGADERLIDYYAQGADLYAFVLGGSSVKGFRLPAGGLDDEIRAFREAIGRRDPHAAALGRALSERLLGPLRAELGVTKLTISPHGALHYLPFAALPEGEGYLIDRFSLRLIPSASTLLYLRTGRPQKPGKLLALGNPDLGDRALDLPNAQLEAVALAAMFSDSRALVRADASKSAIKELGNGFSMLHFATHGRFDADAPLSSGLYLAKGRESNGVLTVSDLYSVRWDVDLVTLSACETGLGKVASGDDVIGLTRGFLYAGARSIVASLWEVDDAATARLMESFYRNLDGHEKREALRLAQIETRQQYPEPWFWAAFNILGRAD